MYISEVKTIYVLMELSLFLFSKSRREVGQPDPTDITYNLPSNLLFNTYNYTAELSFPETVYQSSIITEA